MGTSQSQESRPANPTGQKITTYTTLNPDKSEIRVLIVESGNFNDPLVCSLKVVSLASDPLPSYETISYTWGDASVRAKLSLHGRTADVPASSAAAIRRMRRSYARRELWIDAICINQQDLQERSSQVAFMGTVYMRATGNLIYLGEDESRSVPKYVSMLRSLASKIEKEALLLTGDDLDAWKEGLMPQCWNSSGLISLEELAGVKGFYDAAWFTLWVVQEAALAQNNSCYYGNVSFALNDALLVASVGLWTSTDVQYSDIPQQMWGALHLWKYLHLNMPEKGQTGHILEWSDLQIVARSLSATEPRDRVFALSGLVQMCHYPEGSLPPLIRPNYGKTTDEVFRNASRHAIFTEDDEVLRLVDHEHDNDMMKAGIPSWRIPWDKRGVGRSLERGSQAGRDPSQQVSLRCLESRETKGPDVLEVQGLLLGIINWTKGPCDIENLREHHGL